MPNATTREPDRRSDLAEAWKARIEPAVPDHQASIAQWVLTGPFHPAWNWWAVSAISLRDIPGVPPAHKQYPGAEYEVMIASLDPKCCPPDPDEEGGLSFLKPLDLVYQCHGISEAQVEEILDSMIEAIILGRMSPDQDYRSAWRRFLNEAVVARLEG